MQFPNEIVAMWLANYSHGDYVAIEKTYGLHSIVVAKIIKRGRGHKTSMLKINDYYVKKVAAKNQAKQ